MSILNDVGAIITSPFRSGADAVGRLWHAVSGLFDLTKGVFIHVGEAWAFVVHGAEHVWVGIEGVAESTYHAVEHIVTYTLPHAALWALRQAEHAAGVALHRAEKTISHVISVIRRALVTALRAVEHTLSRWVRFLLHRINSIIHWIDTTAKRAVNLVLHPEHLVLWIMPHLILPLLRFAINHSKPIVKWLMQHAIGIMHELAPEIEAAIKELL